MVMIRRVVNQALGLMVKILGAGVLLLAFGEASAFAIPSPELVVGSLSSISQLLAVGSALLGGSVAVVGVRAKSRAGSGSRLATWIASGLIALLALAAGSLFYLYMNQRAAEASRLQTALIRPMPSFQGRSLDATLKEVSFSEQQNSSRGISTNDLEKLIAAKARGERSDVVLLDIRENAETEMGSLPGAKAVRFPDLATARLDLAGKTAVLFCHNGNRSYETCAALAALGIDCHFLVGGLEKWLVENRTLTGSKARTLADMRALPPYRNQSALLNTAQVHDLVDTKAAVFVDVRYPGEFSTYHLANAINLPIRPTPTEELKARIAQLPHRPIIAVCYDRRSCFFSEVLGLELDRAGYDYRGRYTVPEEYFIATPPRPYIQQWLAESRKSLFGKAADLLAGSLAAIADHLGLIMAILLLAIASRLMVLPISIKAERDQIRSRALSGEMKSLKARLTDDPKRLARAMQAFYRQHGLTPIRNLLGLLFLPVMAISVTAVHQAAIAHSENLLWLPNLASPDHWFVLPLLFAMLITLYLDIAFAETRKQRLLIWPITLPVMTATAALLSAAADVYMIASAALLLAQRAVATGQLSRLKTFCRSLGSDPGVISLAHSDKLAMCGNKAYRLALLHGHGIAVPNGLVLTADFLAKFALATPQWRQRQLDQLWRRLGGKMLAVRSSAGAEDGEGHSFAGIFETLLNVDRNGLEHAITEVMASFSTARAESYGVKGGSANILLQKMVAAEYAGVLFTQDPATAGNALVELVRGTAESLVSGVVAPDAFRYGRLSCRLVGNTSVPIDLTPLIKIGQQAEQLFGTPQDIEWTYCNGDFYLVQSRNITCLMPESSENDALRAEQNRVLNLMIGAAPDEVVFAQNELAEMLPRPTPLSLSLMKSFWANGGSVDMACRSLGLSYHVEEDAPDYPVTIFGRLYVDKRQERARAPRLGAVASRKLAKNADRIECNFRNDFLPDFLHELAVLDAIDFDQLPTSDLLLQLKKRHEDFINKTHIEVDTINIAASFYLERAKAMLAKAGHDPACHLAHIPETTYGRAILDATKLSGHARQSLLARMVGHRAVLDYELAEPRYAEDSESLDILCQSRDSWSASASGLQSGISVAELTDEDLLSAVVVARNFQALKEDAKHHSLRELAVLRRIVLAIDKRLELGGLIFYLTFDECLELADCSLDEARALASQRHTQATAFKNAPSLPPTLTICNLETLSDKTESDPSASGAKISGARVSGSGVVCGRARVITASDAESGRPIANLGEGEIIVSSMVHPAWVPQFRQIGGFVCEIGGWLSHTAIVAREYNLPMIVGTQGLRQIPDGCLLRLNPNGIVDILDEAEQSIEVAA